MRKIFAPILILILLTTLVGCEKAPAPNTTSSTDNLPIIEPVINTVSVTDIPLSEIKTAENDSFAANYEGYDNYVYQPHLDNNGGIYYYISKPFYEGFADYIYYDTGSGSPVDMHLPPNESFAVAAIIDDVIYGVETKWVYENEETWIEETRKQYLQKYQKGKMELLLDSPVNGCYFAEDCIYYQLENKIYKMDYDATQHTLVTEIPWQLYYYTIHSKMVIYNGKLWYCYNDWSTDDDYYDYPLWCYDFDNTFTRFDRGDIEAVNNGFIYYTEEDEDYNNMLYRFNCETFCAELVADDVGGFAFCDDSILYTFEGDLYRLDNQNTKKILSYTKFNRCDYLLDVWCINNRIFVLGGFGLDENCLAEIDIDGNVIEIIHEDNLY